MKQVRIRIIDTEIYQDVTDIFDPSIIDLTTTENQVKKNSINLTYEGADDKFQTLMASNLTFSLLVRDGMDGKFYHLFTGSESRFRVDLLDERNRLIWRGYLLPDQYTEPYKSPTFFVSMTATDCLGILKGKDLPDEYYTQRRSVIDFIAKALQLTGLEQDIYFCPAIVPSNNYRWDQITVDGRAYVEKDDDDDLEDIAPDKDSAYDILERLIHDLGCKLFTYEGKWYIIGVNQLHEYVIHFEKYSSAGIFQSTVSVIRPKSSVTFYSDPMISVQPPFKTVELSVDYNFENTIIDKGYYERQNEEEDGDYQGFVRQWKMVGTVGYVWLPRDGKWIHERGRVRIAYPKIISVSGWKIESNVRGNYIQLRDPIWIEASDFPAPAQKKFLEVDLELICYTTKATKAKFEKDEYGGVIRYEIIHNNNVIASNFPDSPVYDTSVLEVKFSDSSNSDAQKLNYVETRRNLTGKIKIDKLQITQSGYLNVVIYPPVLLNNYDPVFNEVGISTLKIKVLTVKKYKIKKKRRIDYTATHKVELFHVDSRQDNTNRNFRFNKPGLVEQRDHRQNWKRYGWSGNFRYGECYVRNIHDVQPGPHIKIDGSALGIISPLHLCEFHWRENKTFIPTRLDLNFSEGKTEITMIEAVYQSLTDYE
ncbi:hypothetical protein [Myroides odoratus]|uniref:Uncharacterized protein n=1 Tax=Myroides odoratus TaxID=256 RepID=A0A378RQD8_MYROD|nr:hypothetical protein [Myroides odoratus]QQU04035.1 hypothetical protein I6I89_01695 [Myroides odoratus]STZ28579.1 Uncharacterised protein [Myroides odoratus]